MAFSIRTFDYSSKRIIPCVVMDGPPDEKTYGGIGVLYMDKTSGSLYKCVSENFHDNLFAWEIVGEVSDDMIQQAVSNYLAQNPVSGGLSDTEKSMLLTLFRGAVYQDEFAVETTEAYSRLTNLWRKETEDPSHTHSYTCEVTTAATCTAAGVKTFTCPCGASYTEEIPAAGHTFVDGVCAICGGIDPDYDAGGGANTLAMTQSGTNNGASVWYNEDGTEYSCTKHGYLYKSNAVADADCQVTIRFSAGSTNATLVYHVGQIKQEDRLAVYFAEQLGTASTTQQSKTYTVRQGYELVIAVSNQSALTAEVTCADGTFTPVADFYTNMAKGYTLNAYLKSSDGTITDPWSQQNTSDLVDVSEIDSVHIWRKSAGNVTEQYCLTYCFYDSSEVFIGGGNSPASTDPITAVIVPDGAKYMRVGGSAGDTRYGVYVGPNSEPYCGEFVAFM